MQDPGKTLDLIKVRHLLSSLANNALEAEQTLTAKYREIILLRQSLKYYPSPQKYQYQEISGIGLTRGALSSCRFMRLLSRDVRNSGLR